MRQLLARLTCRIAGHTRPVERDRDVQLPSGTLKLIVRRCGRCRAPLATRTYRASVYPLRRA